MSFKDCIDNGEKEGKFSKEKADELRARYEENFRELELDYGPEAEAEAARRTFDEAKFEALERRRRKLLQARAGETLSKAQGAFRNILGNPDPGEFMVNLIADEVGKLGALSSVKGRYAAIRGRAHARMAAAIRAFEANLVGASTNKPLQRDVARAAFGAGDASPEAKALAAAWSEAHEFLRRRFNAAGGHIGKLERWGLPQSHDAVAIRRAGYDQWRASLDLDRARMIDAATGKPFSDGKLELALREVYETVTTDGANKLVPSGAAGGKALANRRADHRFLVFRDADAWLAYQDRFGQRDIFAGMMGHVDAMARDIAAMEVLGPNPTASLRLLEQRARKAAGLAGETGFDLTKTPFGGTGRKVWEAWNLWGVHTGSLNAPVNGAASRTLSATRNMLTAAQLGSAFLSAFSDVGFGQIARRFNGLPQTEHLANVVKDMASAGTREEAARAGLIAESASRIMLDQARYQTEINVNGITSRFADATLRLSLLEGFTQAGRHAFQMEFLGGLAARADKTIDALRAGGGAEKAFARALDRYGLAGAWDEIRKTPPYEPERGATFIRPEDIAARTDLPPSRADYLANRLLEMLNTEVEFATPTASWRARAALTGGARPGSFAGEFLRSAAMYRTFASTMVYLTASRAMMEWARSGAATGLGYIAAVTVAGTMFGALALQARELKSGRDLRPMGDGAFWQAAMLQGGGLGIFGDFVMADANRFGGGLGETLAGPMTSFANDLRKLTIGNVQEAAAGEETHIGREAVNMLRRYTPGGNIWYLELLYQRGVVDQLQRWADPEADDAFRRKERYREQEYGNGYFWAPGDPVPARAPDIGNALSQPER